MTAVKTYRLTTGYAWPGLFAIKKEIPNYLHAWFYSRSVGEIIFITCAGWTLKQMVAITFASSDIFQGPPIVAKAGPEETPRRIALTATEDLPPRKSPVTVQEWVDSLPHPGEVPSSPVIQWVQRAPHCVYIFHLPCRLHASLSHTHFCDRASQIWVRGCLRCDLRVPARAHRSSSAPLSRYLYE